MSVFEEEDKDAYPNQIRPYLFLGGDRHTRHEVIENLGITHIVSCIGGAHIENTRDHFGFCVDKHLRVPMSDMGNTNLEQKVFPEAFAFLEEASTVWSPEEGEDGRKRALETRNEAAAGPAVKGKDDDESPSQKSNALTETNSRPGGLVSLMLPLHDDYDGSSGKRKGKQRCLVPPPQVVPTIGPEPRILIHCAAGINRSATLTIAWLMKKEALTLKQAHADVLSKRGICLHDNYIRQIREYDAKMSPSGKEHSTEPDELPCTSSLMKQAMALADEEEQ